MKTKHVQRRRDSCPLPVSEKEQMNNTSLTLYIVSSLFSLSAFFFLYHLLQSKQNQSSVCSQTCTHFQNLFAPFLASQELFTLQMFFFLFRTPTKSLKLRACHPALQARAQPLEQNPKTHQRYTVDKKSSCIVKLFCKFPSYRPSPFKSMVVSKASPVFIIIQLSPVQTSAMKCFFVLTNERPQTH